MPEINPDALAEGDELRHQSTGEVVEIQEFKEMGFDPETVIVVGGNANWQASRIWKEDRDDWEVVE